MSLRYIFRLLFLYVVCCCIELHPWFWCLFSTTDDDPGPGTSIDTGFGCNPKPVFKYQNSGTISMWSDTSRL